MICSEIIPQFLIDMLNKQYGENITNQIIEGYKSKRIVSLRVNTLKSSVDNVKNSLLQHNIQYEQVSWSKDAFIIKNENEDTIRGLEIYDKGEIYLQSLSSMLPPIILAPEPNTDILDMAAAPGGKTTQMAAITENKANITACEMNKIRAERLKYNIEKQGATCVYCMVKDARQIDDFFSFDKILLDAPCSGSGTLNDVDNYLFTMKLINKSISSQLALLKKALKILKKGSEMVYSTCSILECENEDIINKALKDVNAEIIPIEFRGMEDLQVLPTKIKGTICVCPNNLYEGFFIAKIRKK